MSASDQKLKPMFSLRHRTSGPEPGTPERSMADMLAMVTGEPYGCGVADVFSSLRLRDAGRDILDTTLRLDRIERAINAQAMELNATRQNVASLARAIEEIKQTVALVAERGTGRAEIVLDEMVKKLGAYAKAELDSDTEAELFGPDE